MHTQPPPDYVRFVARHLPRLRADAANVVGPAAQPELLYAPVLVDLAARWRALRWARTWLRRSDLPDRHLAWIFARHAGRWQAQLVVPTTPADIEVDVWLDDDPTAPPADHPAPPGGTSATSPAGEAWPETSSSGERRPAVPSTGQARSVVSSTGEARSATWSSGKGRPAAPSTGEVWSAGLSSGERWPASSPTGRRSVGESALLGPRPAGPVHGDVVVRGGGPVHGDVVVRGGAVVRSSAAVRLAPLIVYAEPAHPTLRTAGSISPALRDAWLEAGLSWLHAWRAAWRRRIIAELVLCAVVWILLLAAMRQNA